ncbi:hypothetical protein CIK05_02495 [Bdellovibrio sp. qaytius]|nr:hypothetical protein CIK05_02495 [Bdellovibrio sp. qaytius]
MKNGISSLVAKLIVILASCTFSLSAFAADNSGYSSMKKPNMFTSEYKPHVGLLAGSVMPENRDADNVTNIGLDIGYAPMKGNFTLGLEYGFSRVDKTIGSDSKEDVHTALLKAGYAFGGDTAFIKDSWVALGAGAVINKDDTFAVASPMVGFDIPVTNQDKEYVTLGASARYNFIENVGTTDNDTTTVNGAVKYWY